jgi:hypothetical protein
MIHVYHPSPIGNSKFYLSEQKCKEANPESAIVRTPYIGPATSEYIADVPETKLAPVIPLNEEQNDENEVVPQGSEASAVVAETSHTPLIDESNPPEIVVMPDEPVVKPAKATKKPAAKKGGK